MNQPTYDDFIMEKGPNETKGPSAVGETSTVTDKKNETRFRSVLPHEPLPIDNSDSGNNRRGYVHLQGAFEPKRKAAAAAAAVDNDDDSKASYWKSSRSKTSLEDALLLALRDEHKRLGLPFSAVSVSLMDPNNLTRLRLEYNGPYEALLIQHSFRTNKISPQELLSTFVSNKKQTKGETVPVFGGRACQATMITTNPLPKDPSTYWPRSNPPKFRRLLHDRGNDEEERSLARFLYITGLIDNKDNKNNINSTNIPTWWNQPYSVLRSLRNVFGEDVEIFLPKPHKRQQQIIQSCHIGFRSPNDAQQGVYKFQGKVVKWEYDDNDNDNKFQSGQLFLDYATITQKSKAKQKGEYEKRKGEASRPECTSDTSRVEVPGLTVVEDFLTEEEEQVLLAVLTGPQAPWAPQQTNKSQTGAVKRLVQHYGYVFDYKTADVLRRDQAITSLEADCPPLPKEDTSATTKHFVREGRGWEVLAKIVEKTRKHEFDRNNNSSSNDSNERKEPDEQNETTKMTRNYPDLNQMTVNHYKPGEGIGSHVDTKSAFGDGLISISLNSGIVMEFTKVSTKPQDEVASKKLVYLPRRSLVLMSGPSRYEWEHQIVTRRTDTHNGVVLPRGLRISLTLRTALSLDGNPLPKYESNQFPPVWGVRQAKSTSSSSNSSSENKTLVTPSTERDHVHAVYDAIATQWHHTRGKRGVLWPSATQFVQNLFEGSLVADVGCGDGKYFPAILEAGSYVIGTDISLPLLETSFETSNNDIVPESRRVSPHRQALQKRPAVAVADCMSVPLRTDSCDAAICIAVMHHLSTIERRIRCLEELARIVKPGGRIHVQAWAMEQASNSKRRFAATDVFVPFNAQPKYLDKVNEHGSNRTNQERDSNVSSPVDSKEEASSKSVAELYSEAYEKADFDERKGLVVFQRYCHMYREGEMDDLVRQVFGVTLVESGYESGNHYVIFEVVAAADNKK